MIKKAIDDEQLASSEFNKILAPADQDFNIHPQERKLLGELQGLLANQTVKRIPD